MARSALVLWVTGSRPIRCLVGRAGVLVGICCDQVGIIDVCDCDWLFVSVPCCVSIEIRALNFCCFSGDLWCLWL